MERMEELEWARILVKTSGDDLPSSLEIEVEEGIYSLSLWWEISPSLRKKPEDYRVWPRQQDGEVRDDGVTCTGLRVGEMIATRPEEQLRSNDVTGGQVRGVGSEEFEHRAHIGPGR